MYENMMVDACVICLCAYHLRILHWPIKWEAFHVTVLRIMVRRAGFYLRNFVKSATATLTYL